MAGAPGSDGHARFAPGLMHTAASLYYEHDATQAEIAARLGTSRATVSRLLAEARRSGIVRIDVRAPEETDDSGLAADVAGALGIPEAYVVPSAPQRPPGRVLAPALAGALRAVGLQPGDVLLVSSGRTIYEASAERLPRLPGVVVVPTVGGQDEPEAWYQTNEIVRRVAAAVSGTPKFLYAPALPGRDVYQALLGEPSIRGVLELWHHAQCAVLGIGAPLLLRDSLPRFVPADATALRSAVADVCSRFYDREGASVPFPGLDRLVATSFEALQSTPVSIGVAAGETKVQGIIAGARKGYFNRLVTDSETASGIILAVKNPQNKPAARRS
ncbi:MAG: sugar-binding transcriptional regulator [Mycobacteriales bacterium]